VINLPLTIEKDAFYDTKTSCFALMNQQPQLLKSFHNKEFGISTDGD
jgi:hypothetical protein